MRVVIDTSVFLAAATHSCEDAFKVLDLLERQQLIPVFNQASWDELCYMTPRVISKHLGFDYDKAGFNNLPERVQEEIELWRLAWNKIYCVDRYMVEWESPGDYIGDPDDEAIVAAALDGSAWFIIHDDSDFDSVPPLIVVPEGHEVLCCRPGEFAGAFPDWLKILRKKIRDRVAS